MYILAILVNKVSLVFVYAVYVLASICAVVAAVIATRNRKGYSYVLTPGLAAFLVLAFFLYLMCKDMKLSYFDEFTHWGLAIKNMYNVDILNSNAQASTTYKSYQPMMAIIGYFFTKLGPVFNEGSCIFAMDVVLLSFMSPIFTVLKEKRARLSRGIALGLIVFFLPKITIIDSWKCIYVDHILGVLFGHMLYQYFANKHDLRKSDVLMMCTDAVMLALTKSSGVGLATIAIFVMVVDRLLSQKGIRAKLSLKNYIPLFICAVCLFVAKMSWSANLQLNSQGNVWNTDRITINSVMGLLAGGESEEWQMDVLKAMALRMSYQANSDQALIKLSFIVYPIIWWAISELCALFVCDEDKGRIRRNAFYIIGGYFVYLISLFLLYVFIFSRYEALILASFERYVGTYLIGATMFMVYQLIRCVSEQEAACGSAKTSVVITGILLSLMFVTPTRDLTRLIFAPEMIAEEANEKREVVASSEKADFLTDEDRVFIVAQDDSHYYWWISRYNMTPHRVNDWGSWHVTANREEWAEALADGRYTYLYLVSVDEYFCDEFSDMFRNYEIEQDCFYRIEKDEDEQVFFGLVNETSGT